MNTAKVNQTLAAVVIALVAVSAYGYYDSVTRAERFERGQKFLPNLNPDDIVEISIRKGEDDVLLKRQGEEFKVSSANGYPAANDSVNRFVRDILDLGLEKKVGKGEGLEEDLALRSKDTADGDGEEDGGTEATEIAFVNANGKDMVRFVVSDGGDEGDAGSYVVRRDGEDKSVYLTSKRLYLRTKNDDFIKKDIVDVKSEDVVRVVHPSWEVYDEEGTARLAGITPGKKESSKVNQAKGLLSSLRFSKHFLANAQEVVGLVWDTTVEVHLNDDSVYVVSVAQSGEQHYLTIQGTHKTQRLTIDRDAGDEEVQETADTLQRLNEIDEFNQFHGSWVYEITEWTAKKFRVPRDEMMEDA